MFGVFLFTLRPCSLCQSLSKSLELVHFGLGYVVVKSTCRTHPNFTWLLESQLLTLCLYNKTEPSLQLHKDHYKSYSLRLGRN